MTYPVALSTANALEVANTTAAPNNAPSEADAEEMAADTKTDPFETPGTTLLRTPPPPPQPNPYWHKPPPSFHPLPDNVHPQPRLRKDEWHPLLADPANLVQSQDQASTPSLTHKASTLITKALDPDQQKQWKDKIVVPPPAAFRNLSKDAKHALQARNTKTRSRLEHILSQQNSVVVPPQRPEAPPPEKEEEEEGEEEEGEEEEDADEDTASRTSGSTETTPASRKRRKTKDSPDAGLPEAPTPEVTEKKKAAAPEVRYNPDTGDWEMIAPDNDEDNAEDEAEESDDDEELEEWEYDLEATLGLESQFNMWNSCVQRKLQHERKSIDPTYSASPLDDVTGSFSLKIVTPQLLSFYSSTNRRPAIHQFLLGRGLRMGSALTTTTAPSTSSFTSQLPAHLKDESSKMGNGPCHGIGPTPPSAFACHDAPNAFMYKDDNFGALITEKGDEVEEVTLEGMQWIGEGALEKIGSYCPNLKLLNLAQCVHVTDAAMIHIARNCSLLAYLNVSGCTQLTAASLKVVISSCKNLEVLCAFGIPTLDEGPGSAFQSLHECRTLRCINVSYCPHVSDAALISIAQYCPSLQMLDISGCSRIGDVGLQAIGSKCSNLLCLIMKLLSQPQLTSKGLQAIARAPRNLKRLDMTGVVQLDNDTLKKILVHLPCLNFLSLNGCKSISDDGLEELIRHCKQLQRLDISSCQGIRLQPLLDLIHYVTSLTKLVVSESCISDAEVSMLAEVRPRCRIIKNKFQLPPRMKQVAFKPVEEKKKKKAAKGDKKKK
eukprot:NODE_102_length_2664_cov_51.614111_g98_i0.p1 GENE.NODE_102_length_2664_cov_51.614111_g98_i0~~NODE_102_length_2664_cov_51.614111_g98_i0.p1  ORF type:complete len:838 (+),score=246.01 NODE_102_length_2664_cov_51.614111_g98_i0:191-2515(+)